MTIENKQVGVAAMTSIQRISDYKKILPIIELYPCIQGEGSLRGNPTIAVRTTGCTHRCYFGEGGWCDSWYSSIHAEKGRYSFQDIVDIYDEYPQIKHLMLTGGSPTMHPALINELTYLAQERNICITLETEGSHFVATDYPLNLLSISPKFSNSIPVLGSLTPGQHKVVDEKFIKTHQKYRLNQKVISQMINYHEDYYFKPVWDGSEQILAEIESFRIALNIPKNKTWLMPAGDTRKKLVLLYPKVVDVCIKYGYCFTGRDQIINFDQKRMV